MPFLSSRKGSLHHGAAPCGCWQRLTVIGALGVEGVGGAMTIAAATGGAVFAAFPEQVLLPERRRTKPDAVIVMDNLGAHKAKVVREPLGRSGVADRDLPPYSPDLNPIALAWAEIKARRRRAAARPAAALHAAVTSSEAGGRFRHAG